MIRSRHFFSILTLIAGLCLVPSCSPVMPDSPQGSDPDDIQKKEDDPKEEKEEEKEETAEADWKSYKKVSKFPTVRITTSSSISKETYVSGTIVFEDEEGMYTDKPRVEATMQIRGRGNTTWNNPKKPYRIKLDEKSKVLGMKSNRDWVLLANYSDKTLMRNTVAMEISRICGMEWTPHCRAVELYLNNQYVGTYDIFQKVEVAKEKVNITENDYFLEVDTSQDEPVSFMTDTYGLPLMFKQPEYPTSEQQKYVKDYFAAAEAALSGRNFTDPEKGYAAYVDVDSFINFYIVQELVKNVDGALRKSSFITLPADGGKARLSCVWDFDLCLGNANYLTDKLLANGLRGDNGPEGWWVRYYCRTGKSACWYSRLFEDPAFTSALKERWNEVKPELDKVPEMIDALYELNSAAYANNFKCWKILGTSVWPNVVCLGSYDKELAYMKDFYLSRLAWMDKEINALCITSQKE